MAERVGFEPTVGCPTRDFQSRRFVHSRTSPDMAEGVGFEPTVGVTHTRFRDARIRPDYATPPEAPAL
jgi:hypothetical protein